MFLERNMYDRGLGVGPKLGRRNHGLILHTQRMAMTLDELRKAFHEAMPGPRKGDLVDMMTKTRPISTVVESPGRVFTADKLGSKVISQFESHEDFSVLKSTTKADPNKPPPSYNAVCLKHPETGEIKFAYDQTLELQLINKLFNGQSRVSFRLCCAPAHL